MKPTFLLPALLLLLTIPSVAQKFHCPVSVNGDLKFNIVWAVAINDNSLVFRLSDQTDSLVLVRKQTPDHKEIRYNDGVKDFVMIIAEKQGIMDGEKYTHLLMATPEDKSMKTTTYYCVKK
jgi:hypothetical protein